MPYIYQAPAVLRACVLATLVEIVKGERHYLSNDYLIVLVVGILFMIAGVSGCALIIGAACAPNSRCCCDVEKYYAEKAAQKIERTAKKNRLSAEKTAREEEAKRQSEARQAELVVQFRAEIQAKEGIANVCVPMTPGVRILTPTSVRVKLAKLKLSEDKRKTTYYEAINRNTAQQIKAIEKTEARNQEIKDLTAANKVLAQQLANTTADCSQINVELEAKKIDEAKPLKHAAELVIQNDKLKQDEANTTACPGRLAQEWEYYSKISAMHEQDEILGGCWNNGYLSNETPVHIQPPSYAESILNGAGGIALLPEYTPRITETMCDGANVISPVSNNAPAHQLNLMDSHPIDFLDGPASDILNPAGD